MNGGNDVQSDAPRAHVRAARGCPAAARPGAGVLRAGPDRRVERPVERVRRQHGAGQRAVGPARGGRVRRADRHEDRDPRRRPPEQGRHRLGDRARLVRPRRRARGGGPRQLGRGARGQHGLPREEQGLPRLRGRHHAADRRAMLAEYGAMDLRHLRADHGAGAGADAGGQGQLVLHHRRLHVRPEPAGRDHARAAASRRQGGWFRQAPAQHGRFLRVPAAGEVVRREGGGARQRRRRHRPLRQAGPRVRAGCRSRRWPGCRC